MRSYIALMDTRAEGGSVTFSWSTRMWSPALDIYGFGNGLSRILRTVLGLMPVSQTTRPIKTPFWRS
jgi:hypothetical protein